MASSAGRKISSIAISGQACSGKTTLANMLAANLGWNHVNVGQAFRDLAKASGILIENFGSLDDVSLRKVDQEVQVRMKRTSRHVWEGRLTAWLARPLPDVMSIYCLAEDATRATRCAKRQGISLDEAKGLIFKRDEEERVVFKRLYNISDIRKETRFDLSIDTSRKSPKELLDEIKAHLEPMSTSTSSAGGLWFHG